MNQQTDHMVSFQIEPMAPRDWAAVRSIYLEGITSGNSTFETDAPSWEQWDAARLSTGRLVARSNSAEVIGWAALSPVSARHVYRGVAEVSIYVKASARGHGVGTSLLNRLIETSEEAGIWTLQGSILPENSASLALVKRCGFRQVGRREKFGCLHGTWRDILLVERRSSVVGV